MCAVQNLVPHVKSLHTFLTSSTGIQKSRGHRIAKQINSTLEITRFAHKRADRFGMNTFLQQSPFNVIVSNTIVDGRVGLWSAADQPVCFLGQLGRLPTKGSERHPEVATHIVEMLSNHPKHVVPGGCCPSSRRARPPRITPPSWHELVLGARPPVEENVPGTFTTMSDSARAVVQFQSDRF